MFICVNNLVVGVFVGDHLTGEKLFSSLGSPYVVCLLVTILLEKSYSVHLALHTWCVCWLPSYRGDAVQFTWLAITWCVCW